MVKLRRDQKAVLCMEVTLLWRVKCTHINVRDSYEAEHGLLLNGTIAFEDIPLTISVYVW